MSGNELEFTRSIEVHQLVRGAVRMQSFLEHSLQSCKVAGFTVRWEKEKPWEERPEQAVLVVEREGRVPMRTSYTCATIEAFGTEAGEGPMRAALMAAARAFAQQG